MLVFGEKLINLPVLSLQTSREIARTSKEVFNPTNLTVVAYYVEGPTLDFSPAILRTADIREISKLGAIVNDSDDISHPEDLIVMQSLLELDYELEGMPVIDKQERRLGKVSTYTIEPSSFTIQQLYVKRPLLQSLNDAELIIHRSQIVAITDKHIVVTTPDAAERRGLSLPKELLPRLPSQRKAEARETQ